MILTPITEDGLDVALARFAAGLADTAARAAFARIRRTAPRRAAAVAAERHRRQALAMARGFGMAVYPAGQRRAFTWDGKALSPATEAYVILHEVAHFALAPQRRRCLIDFGLGPGPDTTDSRAAARAARLAPAACERDEAAASLLGILWEAALGQPALASFLDQNWLEGLERSAATHFAAVLGGLRRRALIDRHGRPAIGRRERSSLGRIRAGRPRSEIPDRQILGRSR